MTKWNSKKTWKKIKPLYCPLCYAPLCTSYAIKCNKLCIHTGKFKGYCIQQHNRAGECHCDEYSVIKALVKKYKLEEVKAYDMHPDWFNINAETQIVSIMEYLTNNQAPDVMKILDDSLFTI